MLIACTESINEPHTSFSKEKSSIRMVLNSGESSELNRIDIWIVDKTSSEVIIYESNTSSQTNGNITIAADKKSAKASFDDIERGEYTLYVTANLPSYMHTLMLSYIVGTTIDNAFTKAVMQGLDQNKEPQGIQSEGMPMSLKKDISLASGVNKISGELVRACGKIRISIKNNTTDKIIFMNRVKLNKLNPDKGYLFESEDGSIPENVVFDDLSGIELTESDNPVKDTDGVSAKPGETTTLVSQYMYETGVQSDGKLSLLFFGGIYDKSISEALIENTSVTTYTTDSKITSYSNIATNAEYFIRDNQAFFYLYSDGTNVRAKSLESMISSTNEKYWLDEYDNFLWTFSSNSSSSQIRNTKDRKYISIPTSNNSAVSMSNSASSINLTNGTNGIYFSTYYWRNNYYATVKADGESLKTSTSTSNSNLFNLYKINKINRIEPRFKDAETTFGKEVTNLTYINEYGIAVPLNELHRNEDLNIMINIFYNPEWANLYFKVESWTESEMETTFD